MPRPPTHAPRSFRYGSAPGQEGELFLPHATDAPVIVLLHGGFWRMPWGREETAAVARDLAGRGVAVWNVEYRRVGAPGGGWPGTLQDVVAAVDHLAVLRESGSRLDLGRVVVAGHSAGGHLALWVAGLHSSGAAALGAPKVRIRGAFALAPIADLSAADALGLGRGAVAALLGGRTAEHPERCRASSPRELLPLGVPQVIVHGSLDDAVPLAHSRAYAEAARSAGDVVELVELPGVGHMELVDPESAAYAAWCERAVAFVTRPGDLVGADLPPRLDR